ncbi:MAG: restriction endonuclease [Caldilineaceae bacterium]
MKRFGLIENPSRGQWRLTEAGNEMEEINPNEVVLFVKDQMKARQDKVRPAPTDISNHGDFQDKSSTSDVQTMKQIQVYDRREARSPTPDLPEYSKMELFLNIIEGVTYADYRAMYGAIWSQRGNPQETVEWADPDVWIPERLHGADAALAGRIWNESRKQVNPRYVRGLWYLANRHDLLNQNVDGLLQITDSGHLFLHEPEGDVVAAIDEYEGILTILQLVAEKGPGRRSEFLGEFSDYCRSYTTHKSDSVIKGALYDRLLNLSDRNYVQRRGQSYEVTDRGLAYLDRVGHLVNGLEVGSEKQSDIRKIAKAMRDEARNKLQTFLLEMHPGKFEELIKLLLEEMGYDNVETTSLVNDKGVDVIGSIELGITSVKEVIQAKRHRGSINRPVLDQLRGSLHRFDAVRGTIITTGRYSKGAEEAAFERGAAPITLIDGEKLLDLLMEHQIGVTKKSVDYFEFAPEQLAQFEVNEFEGA